MKEWQTNIKATPNQHQSNTTSQSSTNVSTLTQLFHLPLQPWKSPRNRKENGEGFHWVKQNRSKTHRSRGNRNRELPRSAPAILSHSLRKSREAWPPRENSAGQTWMSKAGYVQSVRRCAGSVKAGWRVQDSSQKPPCTARARFPPCTKWPSRGRLSTGAPKPGCDTSPRRCDLGNRLWTGGRGSCWLENGRHWFPKRSLPGLQLNGVCRACHISNKPFQAKGREVSCGVQPASHMAQHALSHVSWRGKGLCIQQLFCTRFGSFDPNT